MPTNTNLKMSLIKNLIRVIFLKRPEPQRLMLLAKKPPLMLFSQSENYQPKGNYALVGASYTKTESDNKYQPTKAII